MTAYAVAGSSTMSVIVWFSTEVPGGDGSHPVPHHIFPSGGTPEADVRTFWAMASDGVLAFHRFLPPADVAPAGSKEGLQSVQGQTPNHPGPQRQTGRTTWQDDGRCSTVILWTLSNGFLFRLCLEPFGIWTLLVVDVIATFSFFFPTDAHIMQKHFLALNIFCCCDAVSFPNKKWHAQVAFNFPKSAPLVTVQ